MGIDNDGIIEIHPYFKPPTGRRGHAIEFTQSSDYFFPTGERIMYPTVSSRGRRNSYFRDATITSFLTNGFPYSSKLSAHTSCVNALSFSSGEGRFLASGGDDCCVYLWDFHQEDATKPIYTLRGPKKNVFAIAFSTTNRYIFSAGTDDIILKYDFSTVGVRLDSSYGQSDPDRMFREHDDTIRGLSCHPSSDEIFLSAGQDGRILLHDGRETSQTRCAQNTLQLTTEATGVQFHPTMECIFATCDSRGRVCLRDTRMAFGPLQSRSREGIVREYVTKLTRKSQSKMCRPEASSLTFNADGSKLAVIMLNFLPTIYGLSDPIPLAVVSGKNHPDGTPVVPPERAYSNSCTIKNGAFGNFGMEGDEFYTAGSEDFRGYVWKVPTVQELVDRRNEISAEDWLAEDSTNVTAFTNGGVDSRFVPVDLSTPHCYLHGHKSIVNSTICHPHLFHVVTCGIEKDIILHSPTPTSPCAPNLERTSTEVRIIDADGRRDRSAYYRALAGIEQLEPEEITAIRMFDHIIREEGDTDVFDVRQVPSSHSSSEDESPDEDEDADNWL